MANSIVKSALPTYVEQHRSELLIKAMTDAKTLKHIEKLLGVKGSTSLNILNSTVVFGDGSTCGFEPDGADTLSQRVLEAKPIKVQKDWCQRSLYDTYLNHDLLFKAGYETMPYEQKFVDSNLSAIAHELDKTIWQGNATLGINGFVNIATAASSGVLTASGVGVEAAVEAVYAAIPADALSRGAIIFVSETAFKQYINAVNGNCCANRPVVDAALGEIPYAGDSRVKIVAVPGLEGTNYIFGSAADNFVYGTDIEDAHASADLWYSEDNRSFRMEVLFTAGVQFKFPAEVVLGTIANA